MADRKLVLDILARDRASRALGQVGDAADDAGDSLRGMGTAARQLDADLERNKQAMRVLAQEMAGLDRGSARFKELSKDFSTLTRDAGQIKGLRKAFGEAGSDGAAEMALSFSQRIGPLLATAPISPPIVAAITAATPLIAGAISGAVLAGLGTGAVAVGVAAAFRDPRVARAIMGLTDDLQFQVTQVTKDFAEPTLAGVAKVRLAIREIGPDVRSALAPAVGYIDPLINGLTGFIHGVLPGLAAGVAKAGPVVDALSSGLTLVGVAIGNALTSIADGSDEAAVALSDVLTATAVGVQHLGDVIGILAKAYSFLRMFSPVALLADGMAEDKAATDQTNVSLEKFIAQLRLIRAEAPPAAAATLLLSDAEQKAGEAGQSAFDSQTKFALALREAASASKGASGGIDLHTAAGLRNRQALGSLAATTRSTMVEQQKLTGGTLLAARTQMQGYEAFMRSARGMGVSKAAATALARELRILPTKKTIDIIARAEKAMQAAAAVRAAINNLRNKHITITGSVYWTDKGIHKGTGTQVKDRWGGVHVARQGLLRNADVYSPRSPGRYMFAEPATGGEAFIPKRGNRQRSMSILQAAASWYGASVVPGGGASGAGSAGAVRTAGGGGAVINLYAGVIGSQQQMQDWLARAVDDLRRKGRL